MNYKILLLALSMFLMLGCTTDIADIKENPKEYADKEVTIKGEVVSTTNAFFLKYYTIKDNTGEINVTTKQKLPDENTKVKISGTVRELLKIGDMKMTVIEENDRN